MTEDNNEIELAKSAEKPAKARKKTAAGTKKTASSRVTVKMVDEKFDRILAEISASGGRRQSPETERRIQDIYFMSADLVERVRALESRPVQTAGPAAGNAGEPYVTSREQFEIYSKLISRREGELADSKFMSLLTSMCQMREDIKKLLANMERNKDNLTVDDALDSFETYEIDLANMLTDAGVVIGPYGKDGDRVDTVHQLISDTLPTDDPELSGKVAERLSEGYEYNGRAVVKEKVIVYKKASQRA